MRLQGFFVYSLKIVKIISWILEIKGNYNNKGQISERGEL